MKAHGSKKIKKRKERMIPNTLGGVIRLSFGVGVGYSLGSIVGSIVLAPVLFVVAKITK